MRQYVLLTAALLAMLPAAARANFGLFRRPAAVRYYSSYYVVPAPVCVPFVRVVPVVVPPAPIPVVPVVPVPAVVKPVPTPPPLAAPRPAPPSTTPEPPPAPPPAPGPELSTSRKVGSAYYTLYSGATPGRTLPAADRCSVAFWNLTGQALTIQVNGQRQALAPGRSVTLELPHSFAWKVEGREAEAARVPNTHTTGEILIRR